MTNVTMFKCLFMKLSKFTTLHCFQHGNLNIVSVHLCQIGELWIVDIRYPVSRQQRYRDVMTAGR